MKKKTEAIACRDSQGAEATKIVQTEQRKDRFELTLKCITRISAIVAGTVLILNAGIYKLLVLLGFGIIFSMIYFGFRD